MLRKYCFCCLKRKKKHHVRLGMRWVQGENYEWGKYKRKEWKKKKKKFWVYPINVDRLFLLFVVEYVLNGKKS